MANGARIKRTKPGAMEEKGKREKEKKREKRAEPRKRRAYRHTGGGQIC